MKFAVLILILLAVPTTQWCPGNLCYISSNIIPPEIESISAVTTQQYPSLQESPSPPKINPSESPDKEQQPEVRPTKNKTSTQAEACWYKIETNAFNASAMIFYHAWEQIIQSMKLIIAIIIITITILLKKRRNCMPKSTQSGSTATLFDGTPPQNISRRGCKPRRKRGKPP